MHFPDCETKLFHNWLTKEKEGRRKRTFVDVLYVILESLFAKVDVHSSSRFSAFFRNPLCLGLMAKAHLHNPRSHLHKDRPWKKLSTYFLPLVWPWRFTTSEGTNSTSRVNNWHRSRKSFMSSALRSLFIGHMLCTKLCSSIRGRLRRPSFKNTSVALESILKVLESIWRYVSRLRLKAYGFTKSWHFKWVLQLAS